MANGKTKSQIFSGYLSEASDAVSSFVEDSQAKQRMQRRLASLRGSSTSGSEQPKPSDILKEYKARVSLGKLEEKEIERKELGLTRLEYDEFKAGYEEDISTYRAEGRALSKTVASEGRALSRTLATEGRTADRAEEKASKIATAKVEEVDEQERGFQKKIEEGSGFLPSIIRGEYPKTNTTFSRPSDIPIITDSADAMDRTETKAFITLEDIDFMIQNNEFDKAKIPRSDVIKALNINPVTGVAEMKTADIQSLMFRYLRTPYGKGFATAMKMNFKDPNSLRLTDLGELLIRPKFGDTQSDSTNASN